jgi:hypothetical protein
VPTTCLAFSVAPAAAGGAAGAAPASHEEEIRWIAAAVIASIAIHGLVQIARERRDAGGKRSAAPAAGAGRDADAAPDAAAGPALVRGGSPRAHFARFLAITLANPLTVASFAAVAAALSLDGALAAAAFAGGVGLASAAWHLLLSLAAGHAGRWVTPAVRRGFAVVGRLAVVGIAAHLALG